MRVSLSMIAAMSEADQRKVTEADFQDAVVACARNAGWLTYHVRQTAVVKEGGKKQALAEAGFPDLVLARAGCVHLWELKKESGKTTQAQDEWLAACSGSVKRPSDAREIAEVLDGTGVVQG